MQFLNNFPVKFNLEEDSCLECDGRDFCQLAQWSDRFEFAIEPGTTDVAVVNGTFTGGLSGWDNLGGDPWTAVNNKARCATTTDVISQPISKTVGRKYKISFTISNYSGTGGLDVQFGSALYSTQNSNGANANGTYVIYLTPADTTDLFFSPLVATFTLDLDDVTIELVNEDCGIELYNTETGTYSGIRKYANLTNTNISTIGYSYLWSDMGLLYDGCYKIVVFGSTEGENLINNGTFNTNLNGWTADPEWTWLSGKAHLNDPLTVGPLLTQSSIPTTTGQIVRLTFTVSNLASGSMDCFFEATQLGSFTVDGFFNGTYTFDLVVPSGTSVVSFSSFGSNTVGDIDNVSLVVVSCAEVALSQCYKLATEHPCETKLLSWTNEDTNGFNYPYYYFYNATNSYGFQWMRVECDLRNAKYPGEAEKYIDSGGNNILYLGNVRKLKDFIVGMIPEYMHDALANGFKHKAFYIDDVRYTFEDTDYTPEWSTEIPTVLAESTSLVGKYNQDNNSID